MSASIPLDELKSLIHDAFPGAAETQAWLRQRFGLPEAEPSGALELALASLSAQPGDEVLTRLLGAAPFLVDRVRVLAVALGLTLPAAVLEEADFTMRQGVSVLVNLLAGGDYALAYHFFHRCFAWGAKAADVEPGHFLASLDRLTDNLLQLGVHKHEELFKVLLAEHPGHAEEIRQLARLMGHFTLASDLPVPPPPDPTPVPPVPSALDRLFALLHRARLNVVAWPRPSRFALLLVPSLTFFAVFFTASAPYQEVEETLAQMQVERLLRELESEKRRNDDLEKENSRLEAVIDEIKQEIAALKQKYVLTQQALEDAKKQILELTNTVESLRRRIKRLVDDNAALKEASAEALVWVGQPTPAPTEPAPSAPPSQ